MEQIKETWELMFNWLGNGKKMIMGGTFLLAGIIGQTFSEKTLAQIPFLLMAIGVMCFVNALFSKITAQNIHLLYNLMINVIAIELCISIASSSVLDGVSMMGACAGIVILVWILQVLLLKVPEMSKRIMLGFLETLLNVVAVAVVFLIPIFISL